MTAASWSPTVPTEMRTAERGGPVRARARNQPAGLPASGRAAAPATSTSGARGDAGWVEDLQATAGNRAVVELLGPVGDQAGAGVGAGTVQRQPRRSKRAGAKGGGSAATATAGPPARGAAAPTGGTADELVIAEAWLRFIALRGNATAPRSQVPSAYGGILDSIQSAVGGPGPTPSSELLLDDLAFAEARTQLKRMRADHARLTPKAGYDAYDLADVAIERGQINFQGGPDAFEGGANQLDQAQVVISIQSAAGDELKAAKEAGYQIPKALAELPSEAQAQLDSARAAWRRGAPSSQQQITPTEEMDLVEFLIHATDTINSMRERRAADIARARRKEADALRAAADKQLVELQAAIADRRRAAFAAGDKDALEKVHEALGSVVSAINETKEAAAIITDRVDQLNKVAEFASKSGKKLIELPKVPSAITGIAGKLESANKKIGKVIEILDLVSPAKTELESGLKYLKAIDMSLEHFGGKTANPFIAVYVSAYLSPGIKNCMQSIRSIAAIMSRQNRSAIEHGQAWAVDWQVEQGGEAVYAYLMLVYKSGGAAPISDAAWRFFSDHRGDLSAAVGDPMPKERRAVSAWASKNRRALWESFYGSVKPPG